MNLSESNPKQSSNDEDLAARFRLDFDQKRYRRLICGHSVIVHCHHYNSRIQRTIESSEVIDGQAIFVSTAETVFADMLGSACHSDDDEETKLRVAAALYKHLGFGKFDLSAVHEGVVTADCSHFVEGWRAGFATHTKPVCSLTEGYLAATLSVCTGRVVFVREVQCMLQGHPHCRFEIDDDRTEPIVSIVKQSLAVKPQETYGRVHSANVDEDVIIQALVDMSFIGDDEGLIPTFNVYLANMPADFYNQVVMHYIDAMTQAGLASVAKSQLMFDAETCGLNTFRGIRDSAEWEALVEPMIKDPGDELYGMIAISNSLGWGNWSICSHEPGDSLELESLNSYEAQGALEYGSNRDEPACLMLSGVAAGIMELVYGSGPLSERFGQYMSRECGCLAATESSCTFRVEEAS